MGTFMFIVTFLKVTILQIGNLIFTQKKARHLRAIKNTTMYVFYEKYKLNSNYF